VFYGRLARLRRIFTEVMRRKRSPVQLLRFVFQNFESDQEGEVTGCLRPTYVPAKGVRYLGRIHTLNPCIVYVAVFLAKASIHASTDTHTPTIDWLEHVKMPCGFGTLSHLATAGRARKSKATADRSA